MSVIWLAINYGSIYAHFPKNSILSKVIFVLKLSMYYSTFKCQIHFMYQIINQFPEKLLQSCLERIKGVSAFYWDDRLIKGKSNARNLAYQLNLNWARMDFLALYVYIQNCRFIHAHMLGKYTLYIMVVELYPFYFWCI